ncbi:MAG: glycosyltransferase [Candidatus Omnitrophica bacterium]|nr:glycosyltransferase [Candidatus Omnitrophota bacterium]
MNSKIKILYLISELNVGGAETMLYDLVTRLDRTLFDITVVSLQDEGHFGPLLKKAGITVESLDMDHKWDIAKLTGIHTIVKDKGFDIIHSLMFHANIIGRIVAKLYKIPINISAVHTIEKGQLWHLAIDRMTRFLVTKETVVCDAARLYMMEKTRIKSEKITVINNGVDLTQYTGPFDIEELKKQYELPPDKKIVGTIGSLTKPKGHIHFIKAAKWVLSKEPDTIFVIVGRGPLKKKLQHKIIQLDLDKHIRFFDYVAPIANMLATFDCFVLSSLWEGVPISLLEAMALKKPVVVTATGGMTEVVKNDKTGFVVPPADEKYLSNAIVEVFKDPTRTAEMGSSAYTTITQRYTIESTIKKTVFLYASLVAQFCKKKEVKEKEGST